MGASRIPRPFAPGIVEMKRLSHEGKVLVDEAWLLSEYGIKEHSTVHLHFRVRGGTGGGEGEGGGGEGGGGEGEGESGGEGGGSSKGGGSSQMSEASELQVAIEISMLSEEQANDYVGALVASRAMVPVPVPGFDPGALQGLPVSNPMDISSGSETASAPSDALVTFSQTEEDGSQPWVVDTAASNAVLAYDDDGYLLDSPPRGSVCGRTSSCSSEGFEIDEVATAASAAARADADRKKALWRVFDDEDDNDDHKPLPTPALQPSVKDALEEDVSRARREVAALSQAVEDEVERCKPANNDLNEVQSQLGKKVKELSALEEELEARKSAVTTPIRSMVAGAKSAATVASPISPMEVAPVLAVRAASLVAPVDNDFLRSYERWCSDRSVLSKAPLGAGACMRALFVNDEHVARGGGEYLMVLRKVSILADQAAREVQRVRDEVEDGAGVPSEGGGGDKFIAEQEFAVRAWRSGRSVFIIGPPGTGKTKVTFDCLKDEDPWKTALLGNTWQQVNLLKGGLSKRGAATFAEQAVVTRAAGLHTGFEDAPNVQTQLESLTMKAKKVYDGDKVWFEEAFQVQQGVMTFFRMMADECRSTKGGFASLQIGASGGADQTLPIQSDKIRNDAKMRGASPRYELPIEDSVLLDVQNLALVPFKEITRQSGPFSKATLEFGLGTVSDAGWEVIKVMHENAVPPDVVWLHSWNSLARDGEFRDALTSARATGKKHIVHVCETGETLTEDDLKAVEERYFYHKQVFVVGRKVLICGFEQKPYLQFADGKFAHHNMRATVIDVLADGQVQVECEGRPIGAAVLLLPKEARKVFVQSTRCESYITGYRAKPYYHQTGANNQGNEHDAVVVDMIGMDKAGLLSMVLSRGKDLTRMKVVNLRGNTDVERRRFFTKMLVVHPKVVLLRVALGEEIDENKFRWAMEEVRENERRYGLGTEAHARSGSKRPMPFWGKH